MCVIISRILISQRSCVFIHLNIMEWQDERTIIFWILHALCFLRLQCLLNLKTLPTIVYLINCLPFEVLESVSLYYWLAGSHLSYQNLHLFGCVCFVDLLSLQRHKLCKIYSMCFLRL